MERDRDRSDTQIKYNLCGFRFYLRQVWDTHTLAYTNTNHTKVPLIISLLTRRLWDIKIQNFICLEVEKLLNCHRVQNPQKKPKSTTPTPSAPPTTRLLLSRSLALSLSSNHANHLCDPLWESRNSATHVSVDWFGSLTTPLASHALRYPVVRPAYRQ